MITAKELQVKMHGGQYYDTASKYADIADKSGLIIIEGASDDLVNCFGVIGGSLEVGHGSHFYVSSQGYIATRNRKFEDSNRVNVIQGGDFYWSYKSKIPHLTFDTYECGKPWCRGLIIDIKDLVKKPLSSPKLQLAKLKKENEELKAKLRGA